MQTMSNTRNAQTGNFVHTLTIRQQPYLFYCEKQAENSYIVTCRNDNSIPPLHFFRTPDNKWQHEDGLSNTLTEIAALLAEIINEH